MRREQEPVIQIEGLGKKYRLGGTVRGAAGFETLRDRFRLFAKNREAGSGSVRTDQTFWALKDVSLRVSRGESLGIIGANGAGKSTLLKVLSRVTEPTEGRVVLRGRVASLLEVGTGFHPELTGRENIFLNGVLLGMSRREIQAKFSSIVEFSGVERFLDTPVKRYSSGMFVRLAFAVAAHVEPDVLIVDEVLAVGDAEFQKRCFGKMREAAGGGRTVLFVSHNLRALRELCPRAVLLEKGRIVSEGASGDIIARYLEKTALQSAGHLPQANGPVLLKEFSVLPLDGGTAGGDGTGIRIRGAVELSECLRSARLQAGIYGMDQRLVCFLQNLGDAENLERGEIRFHWELPSFPVRIGHYSLNFAVVCKGGVFAFPGAGFYQHTRQVDFSAPPDGRDPLLALPYRWVKESCR